MSASPSASTEAIDLIRSAILDGSYAPGQRLVEAELCAGLGVSRGTVRSALIDLTHEGLVERIANRGARVRVVGVDEAVEITEARQALEALCAAKAASRITESQIAELRQLGRQLQAAVAEGDLIGYSRLNHHLDDRLDQICGQSVAVSLLAGLRARNVRHQFQLALRPGRPLVSLPEHLAIIDRVCARDPAGAEQAVRAHLASVIAELQAGPPAARS